jgi:hypothetical protein
MIYLNIIRSVGSVASLVSFIYIYKKLRILDEIKITIGEIFVSSQVLADFFIKEE